MTESNRIEFKREDEFFNGVSIPRNKELMRIFRDVEMVESLGSGYAENYGGLRTRVLHFYGAFHSVYCAVL